MTLLQVALSQIDYLSYIPMVLYYDNECVILIIAANPPIAVDTMQADSSVESLLR